MATLDLTHIDPPFKKMLINARWPNGVDCPNCKSSLKWETNRGYKCKVCGKKYSVYSGTDLDNTKISPFKLVSIVLAVTTWKSKCLPSTEVARQLAITQKTAYYLIRKVKQYEKEYNRFSNREDRYKCALKSLLTPKSKH